MREVQGVTQRLHRGRGTGGGVELGPDVFEVGRHGALGDEQPLGDALVDAPVDDQTQDLELARGQAAKIAGG